MAKRSAAVFSSFIPNKGSQNKEFTTPFEVYLNDSCIHTTEITNSDITNKTSSINVQIAREVMREGLNVIELRNCSAYEVWTHYDFFRMEFKREFAPFAITVR